MTPAHVAVAIVAACGVTGTNPVDAFNDGNGQGRTRVMAAAGCMARLGWDKKAAARVFRVHPNRLSASGLVLARVDTGHLLVIAEALAAHGLCEGDDVRARFLRPYGPGSGSRGDPPDTSAPAAAAETPQRKAGGGEAEAEADVRAQADSPVGPRSSACGPPDPTRDDVGPRSSAETGPPDPTRPVHAPPRRTVTRRAAGSGAAIPVRPGKVVAAAERLKPVTDRVIRWTRQQLALGAEIDFVAWCFGVDAEALADRVRPDVAVAA